MVHFVIHIQLKKLEKGLEIISLTILAVSILL